MPPPVSSTYRFLGNHLELFFVNELDLMYYHEAMVGRYVRASTDGDEVVGMMDAKEYSFT